MTTTENTELIVWSVYYLIPGDCRGHKLKLIYFSRSQAKKIRNQLDSVQFHVSIIACCRPLYNKRVPIRSQTSNISNFDHPTGSSGKTLSLRVKVHGQLWSLRSPSIFAFQRHTYCSLAEYPKV